MLARVDALMGGPHVPTPDADRDALMRVIIAANADTAKRQAEGAAAPAHRRSSRLPSVAAIEEAAAPLPLPALHAASPPGPAAEGEPRAAARLGGAAPRPDARTDLVHKREIRQWFFPLCKMAANVTKRAGFQRDAIATEEKSTTATCDGWLKKRSSKGVWQSRYFSLKNGFLNYYGSTDQKALLASISLASCSTCEPVDLQTGEFNLVFADGTTYNLRAPDSKATAAWCDALVERIDWAKSAKGRSSGSSGGRRRGGDDEEEEEEGDGGRGRRKGGPRRGSAEEDAGDGRKSGAAGGGSLLGARAGGRAREEEDDLPAPPARSGKGDAFRAGRGGREEEDAGGRGAKGGPANLRGSGAAATPAESDEDAPRAGGRRGARAGAAAEGRSGGAGTGLLGAGGGRRGREDAVDSDEEGGGGARRADRSPSPPPSPAMEGWVKKKARTKFGQWQARYLRLVSGVLYFADDDTTADFSNSVDVSTVTEVRPAAGRSAAPSERKVFVLSTTFEQGMHLRAVDEKAVADWVAAISAAVAQAGKGGKRRKAGSEDAADSDADSDAEAGGSSRLPPPPAWYREYERPDPARWMNATQRLLDRLFSSIYVGAEGGSEEGVGEDGAPAERRVIVSKLAEAATRACAELEDRSMEARMRGSADVVKHLIQFFDLKFLNELTPLTTGTAPSKLSPKQVLQLIDCIEGFTATRKRALGSMTLSVQESRPGLLLRETRRSLISKYMEAMGPKLHTVAEKVLVKLRAEKGTLVRRTLGTRVGTNSPTDLFNLMSEHIKVAREGGSNALQRRLLSSVMAEVVFFAREVLMELMDWWARSPADVDMDYVMAVVNDAGVMLDHIEQLEAYFAEALRGAREALEASVGSPSGSSGDPEADDMDREEAEQGREDLAAIEQDIPRAKSELVNAGGQLTGVLVDIVVEDFKDPLAALFATAWEKGNHATVITVTATDYLSECRLLLDPFFFDRLASMSLAHLVEQYMLRLLSPDLVRKDRKGDKKFDFKGGFGPKYKLTEERLKKLVADVVEIGNCFSQFMAREDLALILQCLNSAREMLTIDVDNLAMVLEVAIRNHPSVATHVYLAFERCMALREDLSKAERKSVAEEALKILRDCGQPPGEDDNLFAFGGLHGPGVMHGASMSQGAPWSPLGVTNAIFRSVFPSAPDRAKVLFKDWVAPARLTAASSPRPTAGGGLGSFTSPATPAPTSGMSMDAFMGSSAGTGRKEVASAPAPAPAVKVNSKAAPAGRATLVDDDEPPAPSFTARPARELADAGRRRRRGRGDDDD